MLAEEWGLRPWLTSKDHPTGLAPLRLPQPGGWIPTRTGLQAWALHWPGQAGQVGRAGQAGWGWGFISEVAPLLRVLPKLHSGTQVPGPRARAPPRASLPPMH